MDTTVSQALDGENSCSNYLWRNQGRLSKKAYRYALSKNSYDGGMTKHIYAVSEGYFHVS